MVKVVELKNIEKGYCLGKVVCPALRNVSFVVNGGEFLALVGPSGSGKTSLLNLIGCLDVPTQGSIFLENEDISSLNDVQLAKIRKSKLGFIFQNFNLIPVLSAQENIEFPLLFEKISSEIRHEKVHRLLEDVGLTPYAHHKPNELSGGQQQRVAIARALVNDPIIVLADEPTANLDSKTGNTIVELMLNLNKKKGTTFIFSTHDRMVMETAQRIIKLHDGQIVE
ncbi:MAG: ABC transporter ATP-binding protein [Candidatus Saganbacteria bacterium]|uniref:ABC transporter ATP-binding protein n=1 Tax=Candidatus Saganbacteria bacterium TaxID=2575572 RepID=A0A833P055_UNCSA|nr:MAG: ABC transporter ATP-binding protein [Candidatus Saganbacteria bacterium]